MKRITNLNGLLTTNLKTLYEAEKQQLEELPKIADKVKSPELRQTLNVHIRNKRQSIDRLQQAFTLLDVAARGLKDKVTENLIERCKDTLSNAPEGNIADAGVIGAVQQMSHLNIANLGTAAAHARTLGHEEIAQLLHKSLTEEKNLDEKLSTLAENNINPGARFQV